jgi:hypothetical protein
MPIGSSRAPIWRVKSSPAPPPPPSTINYTLIRWEGWANSSGGTAGGANSAIYEIYIFTNGYIEARFGDWNFPTSYTVGIKGHYTSAGVGVAFANVGAFTSMVQNVTYVWDATVTNPTIYAEYTYVNGVVTAGNAVPSLGAAPAASWPPAGWTNVTLPANLDDSFVPIPITSTTIMGTARTNAYVGSNAYITFGAGSIEYSSLSTTNPPYDKFMFNAADRSYMRVAYKTGSK